MPSRPSSSGNGRACRRCKTSPARGSLCRPSTLKKQRERTSSRCSPVANPTISKDSREEADRNGYRAVHVVVELDGRLAEIQIRTAAQHGWAQIVEKLDETMSTDLKHGLGPADWLEWLQKLSDELRNLDLARPFRHSRNAPGRSDRMSHKAYPLDAPL